MRRRAGKMRSPGFRMRCASRRAWCRTSTTPAPRSTRWSRRANRRPGRCRPHSPETHFVALQNRQLADLTAVIAAIARAHILEGARTVEARSRRSSNSRASSITARAMSPRPCRCSTDASARARSRHRRPRRGFRGRGGDDRRNGCSFPSRANRNQRSRRFGCASASVQSNPLARELARCQAIGMTAKDDAACEAAWVENRQRFFTYRQPTEASPAVARPWTTDR